MIDRRRALFAPELIARVALAWVMICAIFLVASYSAISAGRFSYPDDVMRLIQVRDLLAGQSWFDLHQYRVDSVSGGVSMHGSRLVDVPIAAMIWLLSLLMAQDTAEIVTATVVPLMTFGCALLLAARIAWRLIGAEAAGMVCLIMALSVPVILRMAPLRIDDDGWQIVLALLALNGMMARDPRRGGLVTGLALACWISISVEGLPFALAICGVAALRWLGDRHSSCLLVSMMMSLAANSALIFAATRGFADLTQYCDAVSPVHLGVFAWAGVAVFLLARCEPIPRGCLLSGFTLTAAGAGAIVYFAAPQCAHGGFVALDPLMTELWYRNAADGMPIWQAPGFALQLVVPPVIGVLAALKLAGQTSGWLRRWWYDYALLLGAALLITIFAARSGGVAGALASVPLGWQITVWIRRARNARSRGRRIAILAGSAVALMPAIPLMLATLAIPADVRAKGTSPAVEECPVSKATPVLRSMKKGEILAPIGMAPDLLNGTDHSVFATGHNRGSRGMAAMVKIFTASPSEARAALHSRATSYVALCPTMIEASNYAETAPGGFLAALIKREEFAWLEPVAIPGAEAIKIWRIKP